MNWRALSRCWKNGKELYRIIMRILRWLIVKATRITSLERAKRLPFKRCIRGHLNNSIIAIIRHTTIRGPSAMRDPYRALKYPLNLILSRPSSLKAKRNYSRPLMNWNPWKKICRPNTMNSCKNKRGYGR